MSKSSRQDYLNRMRARYERTQSRKEKSLMITEFCAMTGYEKKHSLKLLQGKRPGPGRMLARRGRRGKTYGDKEREILKAVWLEAEQPCGKRMRAVLDLWLEAWQKHRGAVAPAVLAKLQKTSPAAIDRLLRRHKAGPPIGRPKAHASVRAQVPLRDRAATGSEPGWVQADTVFHCGESTAGCFACGLLVVDTFSQRVEVRATWNRSDRVVHARLGEIEGMLPFALRGVHHDNGGEFMNQTNGVAYSTKIQPRKSPCLLQISQQGTLVPRAGGGHGSYPCSIGGPLCPVDRPPQSSSPGWAS